MHCQILSIPIAPHTQVFWRGKDTTLARNQDDFFRLIMELLNAFVFSIIWHQRPSDGNKSSCWLVRIFSRSAWIFLGNSDQESRWFGRPLSSCSTKGRLQMSSTEWRADFHSSVIKSFLMHLQLSTVAFFALCSPMFEKQLVGWSCMGDQLHLAQIQGRENCNAQVCYLREHTASTG